MDSMDYTLDDPMASSPVTRRQCEASPTAYNPHGAGTRAHRGQFNQPYDPVHDQGHSAWMASYMNMQQQGNYGQQRNLPEHGGWGGRPGPAFVAPLNAYGPPSGGLFQDYPPHVQHLPYNPPQSQQPTYAPYTPGQFLQTGAVQSPLVFPPSNQLPMTNAMSQRQMYQARREDLRVQQNQLRTRIVADRSSRTANYPQHPPHNYQLSPFEFEAASPTNHRQPNSQITEGHDGAQDAGARNSTVVQPSTPTAAGSSRTHRRHRSVITNASSSSDDDEPLLRHGRARSGYASYIASLSSQQRAEVLEAMQNWAVAVPSKSKPGPSKEALDSLIPMTIDEVKAAGEDTNCIICYNDFGNANPEGIIEQPLRLPKCKHIFGDVCIKHWFKENSTCPYCRDKLPVDASRDRSRAVERMLMLDHTAHEMALRRAPAAVPTTLSETSPESRQRIQRDREALRFLGESPERVRRDIRNAHGRGQRLAYGSRADIAQRPHSGQTPGSGVGSASNVFAFNSPTRQSSNNTAFEARSAEVSPAVAVGSVLAVSEDTTSRPSLPSFGSSGNGRQHYSGQAYDGAVNTRNSIRRRHDNIFGTPAFNRQESNSTVDAMRSSAGLPPSSSVSNNFTPQSPRPIFGSTDWSSYQTRAPWGQSESPSP